MPNNLIIETLTIFTWVKNGFKTSLSRIVRGYNNNLQPSGTVAPRMNLRRMQHWFVHDVLPFKILVTMHLLSHCCFYVLHSFENVVLPSSIHATEYWVSHVLPESCNGILIDGLMIIRVLGEWVWQIKEFLFRGGCARQCYFSAWVGVASMSCFSSKRLLLNLARRIRTCK